MTRIAAVLDDAGEIAHKHATQYENVEGMRTMRACGDLGAERRVDAILFSEQRHAVRSDQPSVSRCSETAMIIDESREKFDVPGCRCPR